MGGSVEQLARGRVLERIACIRCALESIACEFEMRPEEGAAVLDEVRRLATLDDLERRLVMALVMDAGEEKGGQNG